MEIEYAGRAAKGAIDPKEGVMVVWDKNYPNIHHPSHSGVGVAGTGSVYHGIRLSTDQTQLQLVMTHEMGHVIGLPHLNEDTTSVMSYQRERYNRDSNPSAYDYRHCKLAMKRLYDVDTEVNEEALDSAAKKRVSDRKALEDKHGAEKSAMPQTNGMH